MNNVSSKKVWMTGTINPHIEPPPITLIKEKHDGNSDKYLLKLKLHRDPTFPTSDLYEFKMSLFDNGYPKEFFCSFITSTQPSRHQGSSRRAKNINTFVI